MDILLWVATVFVVLSLSIRRKKDRGIFVSGFRYKGIILKAKLVK
jgi:hypothetical protein